MFLTGEGVVKVKPPRFKYSVMKSTSPMDHLAEIQVYFEIKGG